jgi:anaerobic ribonucleoside-triphosphate reductase activating protein
MAVRERINVARWVARSRANGPGERFVLWVQGCALACPGCWNPDTWTTAPRALLSADELCDLVLGTTGIEGVTFTGGEPFQQARLLAPVAERLRAAGLSVMTFTGHELDELRGTAAHALLAACDIVVTGRFVLAERDTSLLWRGSRNQRVHLAGDRYHASILRDAEQVIELHIAASGAVHATGFPPDDLVRALAELDSLADG